MVATLPLITLSPFYLTVYPLNNPQCVYSNTIAKGFYIATYMNNSSTYTLRRHRSLAMFTFYCQRKHLYQCVGEVLSISFFKPSPILENVLIFCDSLMSLFLFSILLSFFIRQYHFY